MKQLKFRTFIIAMLLASAMGVSAEKVEAIVGDLIFVTIPETITVEGVDYAVTSVGDKALYN